MFLGYIQAISDEAHESHEGSNIRTPMRHMEHLKLHNHFVIQNLNSYFGRGWILIFQTECIISNQIKSKTMRTTQVQEKLTGTALLRALGVKEEDLMEVKLKLSGADKSRLDNI